MNLLPANVSRRPRRGTAYVVMLAMSLMVAVIGLSALYASRSDSKSLGLSSDADASRDLAYSALELAQQWIAQDPNWRSNRKQGAWATDVSGGQGATFSIEVADPADADLANDPYQSVVVTATAKKGVARCKVQVTLVAQPRPLEALKYPLFAAGQLHVRAAQQLYVGNATVATNGTFANEGTLHGNVECQIASPMGQVIGAVMAGAPPKALPDLDVPDRYAAIGTVIDPGNALDRRVLGPGVNPYGQPNPDGVYVVRASGDFRVRDSRVLGTLVILLPAGRKATFENSVNIEPARPDFPAVIVRGDAEFSFTSAGTPLSEPALGVNFNRVGAPYLGVEDADQTDLLPSQIKGLIHVSGRADLRNDGVIRGAILCESAALTDAAATDTREIFYDPELYRSPPRHYTARVDMVPLRGSYRRVVD
jgi:Tfp pilus assembly protein PilX